MLQSFVALEPISHRYHDINGKEYISVSKVLDSLKEPVNWDAIAGNVAGKGKFAAYQTKQDVLDFWKANAKEATDFGTDKHEMQERYAKEFKILDKDIAWEKSIKYISSMFKDHYRSEDEACVYSKKYGVAGTMDKGLFVKKGNNLFSLADYKTALKTNELDYFNEKNKFLLAPVSHLQDCKFLRYVLQLSIYGVLSEECAGVTIRDMYIIFIPSNPNELPYKVHAPYMRSDAIAILEHFSMKQQVVKEEMKIQVLNEIPTFD